MFATRCIPLRVRAMPSSPHMALASPLLCAARTLWTGSGRSAMPPRSGPTTTASLMIPRTSFLPAVAQLALIHPLRTRYSYIRQRTRVKRDMLRHACVAETELTRRVLKALHRDQRLDMRTRLRAMLQLHGMPSYTRGTELKPRCTLTGRAGGVIRPWRMSRIQFREAAINGRLAGVLQARW